MIVNLTKNHLQVSIYENGMLSIELLGGNENCQTVGGFHSPLSGIDINVHLSINWPVFITINFRSNTDFHLD